MVDSRTTARGIGVSGAASVTASVISVATYLWLVSQLTPFEMGIVSLGYSFYLMVFLFKDFGLTPLVISRREISREVLSSAFTLRIAVMTLLVVVAVAASVAMPVVFGRSELTLIMLLIAIALFFESLGFTSGALLQRDLEFRKLAIVDILAASLAGTSTIISALSGHPLYALFVGMVVGATTRSTSLMLLKRVFVPLSLKSARNRELLTFGGKLFANRVTVYLVMNVNIFVLAGQDLAILGIYGLAIQWVSKPADVAIMVVNRVLLPTYSALSRLGGAVFSGFLKSLRLLSVGTFSIFIILFAASPPLMGLLFNDQWDPVVPLILVLLVYGLCRVLAEAATVLLISANSPGLCLAANLLNLAAVASLSIPVATAHGAMGCALLMSSVYVAHVGVLWMFVSRRNGRSPFEVARQVMVPTLSSLVAVATGYLGSLAVGGDIDQPLFLCTVLLTFAAMMIALDRESVLETMGHARMALHQR